MKTEKQKMVRKLRDLGYNLMGTELPDYLNRNGLGEPKVRFTADGFDFRCITALEITIKQLHITIYVSHNNLDEVSVNVFNEELFKTDEDNCVSTVEMPLCELDLNKLKQIIFEETSKILPTNQNNSVSLQKQLKTEDIMKTNDIIWLVSEISAFIGQGLSLTQGDKYVWDIINKKGDYAGEIVLDVKEKEIQFVDSELDTKTYFAIVGLAHSRNLTTGDYFTEK